MKSARYYHATHCLHVGTCTSRSNKGADRLHDHKHAGILVLARAALKEDIPLHMILTYWRDIAYALLKEFLFLLRRVTTRHTRIYIGLLRGGRSRRFR